jgi:hypothetical protein
VKCVLFLLVHGANMHAADNDGNTPLHICARNGHERCAKVVERSHAEEGYPHPPPPHPPLFTISASPTPNFTGVALALSRRIAGQRAQWTRRHASTSGFEVGLCKVRRGFPSASIPAHPGAFHGIQLGFPPPPFTISLPSLVTSLLDHGAHPGVRNSRNQTVLHCAHSKVIEGLLYSHRQAASMILRGGSRSTSFSRRRSSTTISTAKLEDLPPPASAAEAVLAGSASGDGLCGDM